MSSKHCLFVCTTCASKWENGKRVGISGGEKLLAQLRAIAIDWELEGEFTIEEVNCMSACSRSCTISFTGTGKYSYLFGDIPADLSIEHLNNILNCAHQYYTDPTGNLPWIQRLEPLKQGLIAKIPNLDQVKIGSIQ